MGAAWSGAQSPDDPKQNPHWNIWKSIKVPSWPRTTVDSYWLFKKASATLIRSWRMIQPCSTNFREQYDEATRLGLARDELLADFLFLQIQAPGFHRHPAIRTWLTQPGATADERFADLLDVLRNKSQQLAESK
jgi:hypothetical protein